MGFLASVLDGGGDVAQGREHQAFAGLIDRLGTALGKSRYLDGHATDWSQQFWAMLWDKSGGTTLE